MQIRVLFGRLGSLDLGHLRAVHGGPVHGERGVGLVLVVRFGPVSAWDGKLRVLAVRCRELFGGGSERLHGLWIGHVFLFVECICVRELPIG